MEREKRVAGLRGEISARTKAKSIKPDTIQPDQTESFVVPRIVICLFFEFLNFLLRYFIQFSVFTPTLVEVENT
jgi:hypothetical protein